MINAFNCSNSEKVKVIEFSPCSNVIPCSLTAIFPLSKFIELPFSIEIFEQGENSITFTFSELEQLKSLITPSGNTPSGNSIECANAINHSIVENPKFENLEV